MEVYKLDINNHILWFKKQPKWIQYAAKRLLELGEIDVHSVDELVKICIEEAAGNVQDFESEFPSNDFRTETEDLLRICSIGDVHNINALAPKSPLKFGESNLSIIYGLNGSGKSGYVRILKHASGSRNSGTLHSNIYSSEENAQRCSISYEKGGSVKEISWVFGVR